MTTEDSQLADMLTAMDAVRTSHLSDKGELLTSHIDGLVHERCNPVP